MNKEQNRICRDITTQGWSLLDISRFFKRPPFQIIGKEWESADRKFQTLKSEQTNGWYDRWISLYLINERGKYLRRITDKETNCKISHFIKYIIPILKNVFDKELPIELSPHVRFESVGNDADIDDIKFRWHFDKCLLRIIITFTGNGTEFLKRGQKRDQVNEVPKKHAFFFLGSDAKRLGQLIIHRSPKAQKSRKLLVLDVVKR